MSLTDVNRRPQYSVLPAASAQTKRVVAERAALAHLDWCVQTPELLRESVTIE
jgi:hypothetical protein